MSINIRQAVADDCPRLLELIRELALYEKALDEVVVSLEHFTEQGFGSNSVWKAFVAEKDGVVVGFALYYIRYSTWKGSMMYLEDLVVTESMRGNGIGAMLMNALIAESKKKQYAGLVWQVLEWNTPAINFYKKYNANFDNEWVNCKLTF